MHQVVLKLGGASNKDELMVFNILFRCAAIGIGSIEQQWDHVYFIKSHATLNSYSGISIWNENNVL